MISTESKPILYAPLSQTELSHDLKMLLSECGYQNIDELTQCCNVSQLMQIKGFNYHHLLEVYSFLQAFGCEKLLRE